MSRAATPVIQFLHSLNRWLFSGGPKKLGCVAGLAGRLCISFRISPIPQRGDRPQMPGIATPNIARRARETVLI